VTFPLDRFMREWRGRRHKDAAIITQAELDFVLAAIERRWPADDSPHAPVPRWMVEARRLIGQREIPGPKHNNWIAGSWARLGAAWFNDDETPWCGMFVAHCIDAAGLPYPKEFPRAKAWADWGQPCEPTVGAVVVFGRAGGGHVGFLVGESASNFYVLGGNQSNAVNITPIAKARMVAKGVRWPASLGLPAPGLPRMSGGTISVNEA
jgi:uncharacterized protein (TIGR02594 family)